MVKAECSAQVEAKAKAEVVCTPPSLSVDFQFNADLSADAQAEFKAWLEGFKGRFAAMIAVRAKAGIVLEATADLVAAASGAVKGSLETALDGDVDIKATIGLGCAIGELEAVGTVLGEASGELEASVSAFASISGAVGGGG
jgi:hypothetical protein